MEGIIMGATSPAARSGICQSIISHRTSPPPPRPSYKFAFHCDEQPFRKVRGGAMGGQSQEGWIPPAATGPPVPSLCPPTGTAFFNGLSSHTKNMAGPLSAPRRTPAAAGGPPLSKGHRLSAQLQTPLQFFQGLLEV